MKRKLLKSLLCAGIAFGSFGNAIGEVHAQESEGIIMNRLYNPNSGEHFYTASTNEKNTLVKLGWKDEGQGWTAPEKSDTPVYRLYNANAGDHHYTTDKHEKNTLVKAGWKDEGIGWYSDDSLTVPLYRQYNPNAKAGSHNYTTSLNEHETLIGQGWKNEGIAWYGLGGSNETQTWSVKADLSNIDPNCLPMTYWNHWFVKNKNGNIIILDSEGNQVKQARWDKEYSLTSTGEVDVSSLPLVDLDIVDIGFMPAKPGTETGDQMNLSLLNVDPNLSPFPFAIGIVDGEYVIYGTGWGGVRINVTCYDPSDGKVYSYSPIRVWDNATGKLIAVTGYESRTECDPQKGVDYLGESAVWMVYPSFDEYKKAVNSGQDLDQIVKLYNCASRRLDNPVGLAKNAMYPYDNESGMIYYSLDKEYAAAYAISAGGSQYNVANGKETTGPYSQTTVLGAGSMLAASGSQKYLISPGTAGRTELPSATQSCSSMIGNNILIKANNTWKLYQKK